MLKIYNGWAFTDNEEEKGRANQEAFDVLKSKYNVYRHSSNWQPNVDLDKYDVVIGRKAEYKSSQYNIIKNKPNLSTLELLLLCDDGNLCFGGRKIYDTILKVFED